MKRTLLLVMVLLHILSTAANAGRLVDNADSSVTDNTTGLVWQQAEGGSKTWEQALTYCEDLSLAGKNDWRLPNVKELESLTEDSLYNPAIDKTYFPAAYASRYWSSTTYVNSSASAFYLAFDSGAVASYFKSNNYYVRCVR